jgi:UDP-N-acetylmuramoyl-L-alanyl-D-glutamate--2,6-diaminopimelate ligase
VRDRRPYRGPGVGLAMGKPLAELLQGLGGQPVGAWQGVTIAGIATDSRQVRTGDLFVAVPGDHVHGERYAAAAVAAGAAAVVAPSDAAWPGGTPGLRHPAPEDVLAELALRLYDRPADGMRVFGVTGTNGKTTTALLVARLLGAGGGHVAHWTTTEVDDGGEPFRPVWTTPPAHRLQRFFRDARRAGLTDAVIEVSSHAIVQRRIAGVRFTAGIATNVSPDHLDFHRTFANYVAAKRSFIAGLDAGAAAVLNADDPTVRAFAAAAAAQPVTYGFAENADVRAVDLRSDSHGLQFTVVARERFPVSLPLLGRHNASNALAAIATALWVGMAPEAISGALRDFPPPPRRLEPETVGPYTVMNDVAMNEASYETVLRTVAELGHPQVVVVHAIRGQRGPEINSRIGAALAAWNARLAFAPLIVSLSRGRLRRYPVNYAVTPDELAAFADAAAAGSLAVDVHEELEDAIAAAVARLRPGGLLLLLGTFGMDDGPAIAVPLLQARAGAAQKAPPRYMEQRERD